MKTTALISLRLAAALAVLSFPALAQTETKVNLVVKVVSADLSLKPVPKFAFEFVPEAGGSSHLRQSYRRHRRFDGQSRDSQRHAGVGMCGTRARLRCT